MLKKMNSNQYLLEYDNLKNLSIKAMLEAIHDTKGIRLDELKVRDLTYHNGTELFPGEGNYLFREEKKIIYVGKCSSMSFTERIAKHFDIRHFAWMNRLLKIICEKRLNLEINNKNLLLASKYSFENLNLVLINFSDRARINRTERLLRACSEPLNKFKNIKIKNLDIIVNEY